MKSILFAFAPFPFPKREASLTRCASPPDNVSEDCPSFIYPNPTSLKGRMALTIAGSAIKKSMASSTLMSSTSNMLLSLYFTSSTSSLNRLPPQDSQVKCTSARNCISTTCSPSPLQVSQRPPSTLKEKCLGSKPRILLNGCFEKRSLISSYALI